MSALVEEAIDRIERECSGEAAQYWRHHEPRFRYFVDLVRGLGATRRFARVLDIGMSFETVLLSQLLPAARVDCLGAYEDDRFRPAGEFSFYRADLNEACRTSTRENAPTGEFDLIVFMEVLEHLYTPPALVLKYLETFLAPGGILILTTPNAAWLKNRLKLLRGVNPFERLREDPGNMGHIREYTKAELDEAFAATSLRKLRIERRGLYRFDGAKDNLYSWFADHTHRSLSRTLVAVYEKAS